LCNRCVVYLEILKMLENLQVTLEWLKTWVTWISYWYYQDNKLEFKNKLERYHEAKKASKTEYPFCKMLLKDFTPEQFQQLKRLYLDPFNGLFLDKSQSVHDLPSFSIFPELCSGFDNAKMEQLKEQVIINTSTSKVYENQNYEYI
jgi:hypothetical protein